MIREEILEYCERHTTPEPEVLQQLARETHLTQVYPRMLTGHMQGTLLRMITAMLDPSAVLEIGTFTGYGAVCMGMMLKTQPRRPRIHTIEINPEQEEMIRKYLREAGLEEVVQLHIGNATEIIPQLDFTWDLVYIDADKENYLNYYRLVLPRLRPGGFIIADNALWDGKVLDPGTTDKEALGMIEFNEYVQGDPAVENLLLPFRDGIMVIRKLIR